MHHKTCTHFENEYNNNDNHTPNKVLGNVKIV
jgi:hypothetical protein